MTLVALSIGVAGVLMQYFIAGDNIWLIMTGVCLYSITLGMGFVSMWSMIADTVEYAEWHHGVRTEGAIYGFFNFITKIAMAIGGGCAAGCWTITTMTRATLPPARLTALTY